MYPRFPIVSYTLVVGNHSNWLSVFKNLVAKIFLVVNQSKHRIKLMIKVSKVHIIRVRNSIYMSL